MQQCGLWVYCLRRKHVQNTARRWKRTGRVPYTTGKWNHEIVTCFLRLWYDSYKLKTITTNTEPIDIYWIFDIGSRQHRYRRDQFHGGGWSRGVTIYIYIYAHPPPRMTDQCGEGKGWCPSPCMICQRMGDNHLSQTQFQSFQISNIPLSLSFQSFQNV